jgi:O-methyltransferase
MTIKQIKAHAKRVLPESVVRFLIRFRSRRKDELNLLAFLFRPFPEVSFAQKWSLIRRMYAISHTVKCSHLQREIISVVSAFLSTPKHVEGCIVEAGSFKGGSAAKFSIAAKMVNRRLVVFDSFEGLPDHNEPHDKDIWNDDKVTFRKGGYCGPLEEVKGNIAKHGELEVCEFVKGWFEDTMPKFSRPVVAIYLDVDLASSTRTCLKYLYPLLVPGGTLCSQDGHVPLVVDVFNDDRFWEKEIGCPKPHIEGLGKHKLIRIVKPLDS